MKRTYTHGLLSVIKGNLVSLHTSEALALQAQRRRYGTIQDMQNPTRVIELKGGEYAKARI